MKLFSFGLLILVFSLPLLSHAQENLTDSLSLAIKKELIGQGQGSYTQIKSEFYIPIKSTNEEQQNCSITVDNLPSIDLDQKTLTIRFTVGQFTEEILITNKWQSPAASTAQNYGLIYSTSYLSESRCYFEKSLVIGTERGLPNSASYTLSMSCPKGHKVFKIMSCRLNQ